MLVRVTYNPESHSVHLDVAPKRVVMLFHRNGISSWTRALFSSSAKVGRIPNATTWMTLQATVNLDRDDLDGTSFPTVNFRLPCSSSVVQVSASFLFRSSGTQGAGIWNSNLSLVSGPSPIKTLNLILPRIPFAHPTT
jgi:hypothetical protein